MYKQIKSLTIGMENCDMFDVALENIATFSMHGIKDGFYVMDGTVYHLRTAEQLCLVLKEAADDYTHFEADDHHEKAFKRITRWNDLTDIVVEYTDGTKDAIYVEYDDVQPGALGSPNKNQRTTINNLGQLVISVDVDREAQERFMASWTY